MLEQLEQVFPEEDLAAAEREVEGAGPGHVVQERRQLSRRQLRPLLDHPVAMNAALVAAHGEVDVDGERDVESHALLEKPFDEIWHRASVRTSFCSCCRRRPERGVSRTPAPWSRTPAGSGSRGARISACPSH